MHIEVRDLNKWFGQYHAVRNVNFAIEPGQLIGLLGPSGGGKTSVLRMLAGLERPDSGEIRFYDKVVNDVPPQERGIGFVFQHYALFKHMTVFDNIAFGLTIQKWPKDRIRARVAELLELTGLSGIEKRYPHQLSGGQRQRVAFARALAPEPQLLLLDEPFAAIDAKIRKELRSWLKSLIDRVGITSIFVTHDQDEAIEVADEIMIIQQGAVEQKGTPWDIYKTPQTPFVAEFIGESTILTNVHTLKGFDSTSAWPNSKALIRPEYIEVGRVGELRLASASERGVVKALHFRGSEWLVEVAVGQLTLKTYRTLENPVLQIGEEVQVLVHRVYLFNEDDHWVMENPLKEDPMPVHI
ncbi:sulfate ABC transporter ATP-binding protein [Paenibacillus sp. UMB4589-SE434]|uniref:sulfate/molybdate ABC transporter ATP-binding protein n=1 Tax=Paenibacillus sp. UMB4589-SE434 TaxID=3046314 RepID=UPI00254FD86D|nr:sulfate ABC transporter ATP-binding protein [Paenibacillus sp. UMB4589-SE434]MDK8182944.1 sulfate ABC transporter ATP-binding protein [Paenibacillus sp. UMB4589-SE434]